MNMRIWKSSTQMQMPRLPFRKMVVDNGASGGKQHGHREQRGNNT